MITHVLKEYDSISLSRKKKLTCETKIIVNTKSQHLVHHICDFY